MFNLISQADTSSAIDLGELSSRVGFLPQQNIDFSGLLVFVFKIAFIVASVIFLLLLLYGGFVYLTSAGNEENTGKAKRILTQALIGILLVVMSYGIGWFILNLLGITTSLSPAPAPFVREQTTSSSSPATTPGSTNAPTGTSTGITTSPGAEPTTIENEAPPANANPEQVSVTFQAFNIETGGRVYSPEVKVNNFIKVPSSVPAGSGSYQFTLDALKQTQQYRTYYFEIKARGYHNCNRTIRIDKDTLIRARLKPYVEGETSICNVSWH